MRRLFILAAVLGTLLGGVALAETARAQASLSEEHIYRIRQNCVTAQTSLRQLHASDALLRVNRGQLYELISTKLMAPLNSRITLSRLGGLKLTATTLEYDRQIDVFRESYKQYEESMSRTLKINCVDQPVEFYDSVTATREKREKLHEDTKTLTILLQAYKTEFDSFAKEFKENTQ